jgi:hypothetical protein
LLLVEGHRRSATNRFNDRHGKTGRPSLPRWVQRADSADQKSVRKSRRNCTRGANTKTGKRSVDRTEKKEAPSTHGHTKERAHAAAAGRPP